jgi:hypothetical protein
MKEYTEKPQVGTDDTDEWFLANNFGPHVNVWSWGRIKELRAEVHRLHSELCQSHLVGVKHAGNAVDAEIDNERLRKALAGCVTSMMDWGSQEDGIPGFPIWKGHEAPWDAYARAYTLLYGHAPEMGKDDEE